MTAMVRIRPRFSVRTLVILMTLACIYFSAWEFTRQHGPRDVFDLRTNQYSYSRVDDSHILQARQDGAVAVPMPFLVSISRELPQSNNGKPPQYVRDYFLWFNGWVTPISPQQPAKRPDVTEFTFFFKVTR